MRKYLTTITAILFLLISLVANAQQQDDVGTRGDQKTNIKYKKPYADSLLGDFRNAVYQVIDNPSFWHDNLTETLTFIKIDIDDNGGVQNISFSDSADSAFVSEYSRKLNFNSVLPTLNKYSKAMSYKKLSLLLPLAYIPQQRGKPAIDPNALGKVMRFNKEYFSGRAVLLQPMRRTVLAWGNM